MHQKSHQVNNKAHTENSTQWGEPGVQGTDPDPYVCKSQKLCKANTVRTFTQKINVIIVWPNYSVAVKYFQFRAKLILIITQCQCDLTLTKTWKISNYKMFSDLHQGGSQCLTQNPQFNSQISPYISKNHHLPDPRKQTKMFSLWLNTAVRNLTNPTDASYITFSNP